jgi:hypothetical protein
MIKQMRKIWIDGLLTKSLQHAARIELCLQDRPDVLENPLRLRVQESDQVPQELPDGTSIVQVYDRAEGELLILGEPGAGKTTLLLELTRTLLERAEKDEQLPIPIVFNLSSWTGKLQSLGSWMEEELWTIYQVPRKIRKDWIDSDQILPLLDGLDEVTGKARTSCVRAINDYYQSRLERGNSPIVICCRSKEYATLSKSPKRSKSSKSIKLKIQHAVGILPLTNVQINAYFEQAGEQVKELKQALDEDAELHELMRQPLMLNIFTLAYKGATLARIPTGKNRKEMLHTIFAQYVERMLYRREQSKHWEPRQMVHRLTFLAKQMKEHNQTVFSVENLQPTWLSKKRRIFYQWFVKLLWAQCGGLFIGIIGWLFGGWFLGLVQWLFFELILGLVGWGGPNQISRKELFTFSKKKVVCALIFGIIGARLGPIGVLVGYLVQSQVEGRDVRVNPTEMVAWSWQRAKYIGVGGLIGGTIVVWLVPRIFAGRLTEIFFELSMGLVYGLATGLIGGLSFGLSGRQLPKHPAASPNEGIWRSGKNGLLLGGIAGLGGGLLGGFLGALPTGPAVVPLVGPVGSLISESVVRSGGEWFWMLIYGLLIGLTFGLIRGWQCGLDAFVEHFTIRFLLWCSGSLPRRLIPFLDEAVKRLFLYKAGKSYVFVHRLLLDYFSSLDEHIYSEITTSKKKTQKYDTNIQR